MKTVKSCMRKIWFLGSLVLLPACGRDPGTFSILADSNSFVQSAKTIQGKIDILWVIDNSGSMRTSQENVAANFQSFIQGFSTRGYDYHIAVTNTEAYEAIFSGDNQDAKFRDGDWNVANSTRSGVFIITPDTPNISDVFLINVIQGTLGNGDERAFQSFKSALSNPLNTGFLRNDSHLAIIIVSDEDDFSHDTVDFLDGQYSNPAIHTVDSYISYLDDLTKSTAKNRRFSVSSISINDDACRIALGQGSRKVGVRYLDMVEKTKGIKGSLCGDFATELESISKNILTLSSRFQLDREPIESSIKVVVNGVTSPKNEINGWTYEADSLSIVFHGTAIPPAGAKINVDFDPVDIIK